MSSQTQSLCTKCREVLKDVTSALCHSDSWPVVLATSSEWTLIEEVSYHTGKPRVVAAEAQYLDFEGIRINASHECSGCILFLDMLKVASPSITAVWQTSFKIRFDYTESTMSNPYLRIIPATWPENPPYTSCSIISKTNFDSMPLRTSGSAEAYDKIRPWIADCLQNHGGCARSDEVLPDRVIDVEPSDPALVETKGQSGQWAALSHCWGGLVPVRTTTDTKSVFMKGIVMEDLPPTFRDAVMVCRELGIRYLWIDSLCIIQDDRKDWEDQAKQMSRVFGNALLVIAATTARHSKEGLFREQSIHLGEFKNPEGDLVNVFLQRGDVPPSILDTRGWCLQETLLAKATLSFIGPFIKYECPSGSRSDYLEEDIMPMTQSAYLRRSFSQPEERRGTLWTNLVRAYTDRNLTINKDRIPGIAGIATRIHQNGIHSGRYLYGLFEDDLLFQLTWHTKVDPRATRKKNELPSWSWASTDSPVAWFMKNNSSNIGQSISCRTCSVTMSDSPNTIAPISLDLSGRFVALPSHPSDNHGIINLFTENISHLRPYLNPKTGTFLGFGYDLNIFDEEQISTNSGSSTGSVATESALSASGKVDTPSKSSASAQIRALYAFELLSYKISPQYATDGMTEETVLLLLEEVPVPPPVSASATHSSTPNVYDNGQMDQVRTYRRVGIANCEGLIDDGNDDRWVDTQIRLV